jgi:chromosome segregation ATPase
MDLDRMKLSQVKLFTFNASSFPLEPSIEGFLKSKGAVSLDFGATAYINSEAMPAILSELAERSRIDTSNADLVVQLKAEIFRYGTERQKGMEDSATLASQLRSYSTEVARLKEQASGAARLIETLKDENMRLQVALKNVPAPQTIQNDDKLKQSYEKLQKEIQVLRVQNAGALASLKVLEDENEELMQELERLKSQSKSTAAPRTS